MLRGRAARNSWAIPASSTSDHFRSPRLDAGGMEINQDKRMVRSQTFHGHPMHVKSNKMKNVSREKLSFQGENEQHAPELNLTSDPALNERHLLVKPMSKKKPGQVFAGGRSKFGSKGDASSEHMHSTKLRSHTISHFKRTNDPRRRISALNMTPNLLIEKFMSTRPKKDTATKVSTNADIPLPPAPTAPLPLPRSSFLSFPETLRVEEVLENKFTEMFTDDKPAPSLSSVAVVGNDLLPSLPEDSEDIDGEKTDNVSPCESFLPPPPPPPPPPPRDHVVFEDVKAEALAILGSLEEKINGVAFGDNSRVNHTVIEQAHSLVAKIQACLDLKSNELPKRSGIELKNSRNADARASLFMPGVQVTKAKEKYADAVAPGPLERVSI